MSQLPVRLSERAAPLGRPLGVVAVMVGASLVAAVGALLINWLVWLIA